MFLVDQQIASAREEFFQRDACQVRPLVRSPSVPFRLFIHHSSVTETFVLEHLSLVPALALLSLRSHALSSVMHC
jgi:hypothetical protein